MIQLISRKKHYEIIIEDAEIEITEETEELQCFLTLLHHCNQAGNLLDEECCLQFVYRTQLVQMHFPVTIAQDIDLHYLLV